MKGRIIKLNFGLMTSQNIDEVHAGKLPCGPFSRLDMTDMLKALQKATSNP